MFSSYKMSQYFPKPFRSFGRNINVKVDLSNYATKTDIKNISHVNTSSFALKINLVSLKTEVDKLDINKLVPVPTDLSKLSNAVKNVVVKRTVYDKIRIRIRIDQKYKIKFLILVVLLKRLITVLKLLI